MKERFNVTWETSKSESNFKIILNYYEEYKELQFDLTSTFSDTTVHSNLTVEAAKQIRDRLNDFIKEVEGEPMPSVNPSEPKRRYGKHLRRLKLTIDTTIVSD